MFTKKMLLLAAAMSFLFVAAQAWAHTPLCSCYDNGDGTITCEGGFSDGSSAAGVAMKVMDASGKVVLQGKMDKSSTYSFKKPAGNYSVMFDAADNRRCPHNGLAPTSFCRLQFQYAP